MVGERDSECNVCGQIVLAAQPAVWRKDGFDIVRCSNCALVFRRKPPRLDDLAEIYQESYFRQSPEHSDAQSYLDYIADEDSHRRSARKRLRTLGQITGPGELLDLGAAAGFFMDEARQRGWMVRGIDIAPSMADYGRDRFSLDLATGLIQTADLPEGAFDLVTMWDYIEHSIDPSGDIARAWAVLRPGGLLAISTGDIGAVVARISGARWHLLTPRHHNFFFSSMTLPRSLRQQGFEVVSVRYPATPYTLRYCLHKLRTMPPDALPVGRALDAIGRTPLGSLTLPANLWDVMTVVAKKPAMS